MTELETLQANVTQWQDAIQIRKQRADFLRGECDRLIGESIDLSEAKAKQARTKRAEHLTELELLQAELSELARRLDVAQEAVKAYLISQAQAVYDKAAQAASDARLSVQTVLNERLHFMNSGGRGESDESINNRKQIEIKLATAQAAAQIASRRLSEAGADLKAVRDMN